MSLPEAEITLTRHKWDTDKALQSTYTGKVGKYQVRMFFVVCMVFGVIESWLSGFVYFNAIPPKSLSCMNMSNVSSRIIHTMLAVNNENANNDNISQADNLSVNEPDWSQQGVLTPIQLFRDFNVSDHEPKNIHIEFGLLCGEEYKIHYSRIGYVISKYIGALFCGHMSDHVGRKMTFIGASIICYVMILFQILSEDFVSYCFFMIFVGIAAGAVSVISITMIMETFPISTRAIFGLILLTTPFVFDLVIPWMALGIGWWKVLQALCGFFLLLAGLIYWWGEETVYFYIAMKNHTEAIHSLTRISKFNSITFQNKFKEAQYFLNRKKSKSVQCDFQPLLRVQDIPKLKEKYPAFNFADMMNQSPGKKKKHCLWKLFSAISGRGFRPNSSTFGATDYFQSGILTAYILLTCSLWFVNGVTYSSLESHELSWRITKNPYIGYCYKSTTAIVASLLIFPAIYKLGRRWPTFCLYLVGEVCLLASIVAKIEREFTPATLSLIYLIGKAATHGAYMVLAIYTVEIFPTGLRATSLGLGLFFRSIGVILADPDLLNFHDWTSRLIYGFLSLLIGSFALFLPEVKRYPLSRTFHQVETIPSSISKRIRHLRVTNRQRRQKKNQCSGQDQANQNRVRFVTTGSVVDYDPQSTLHTMYDVRPDSFAVRTEFETIDEENIPDKLSDQNNTHIMAYRVKQRLENVIASSTGRLDPRLLLIHNPDISSKIGWIGISNSTFLATIKCINSNSLAEFINNGNHSSKLPKELNARLSHATKYTIVENRLNITVFVERAYLAYLGIKLGDQDKHWASHCVYKQCTEYLRQWTKGTRKSMRFDIPLVWQKPYNHRDDCYF
ncbi:hypothetical protein GJ496_001644 [Pomphorhynchus laevis]|nr:hypothetical protein GJ496_001644 [Pomphorhynchus laevis]